MIVLSQRLGNVTLSRAIEEWQEVIYYPSRDTKSQICVRISGDDSSAAHGPRAYSLLSIACLEFLPALPMLENENCVALQTPFLLFAGLKPEYRSLFGLLPGRIYPHMLERGRVQQVCLKPDNIRLDQRIG